jgi:hypothetical protein
MRSLAFARHGALLMANLTERSAVWPSDDFTFHLYAQNIIALSPYCNTMSNLST